jgi:hypothetical protein
VSIAIWKPLPLLIPNNLESGRGKSQRSFGFIHMSKSKNVNFNGELVNAKVLEELRDNFNTMDILDALDVIDSIRSRVCDLEDMRRDFFLLHGQAHALINGDFSDSGGKEDYTIWELADEIETDIGEWAEGLRKIARMLDKLVMLVPEEEYDDEDE